MKLYPSSPCLFIGVCREWFQCSGSFLDMLYFSRSFYLDFLIRLPCLHPEEMPTLGKWLSLLEQNLVLIPSFSCRDSLPRISFCSLSVPTRTATVLSRFTFYLSLKFLHPCSWVVLCCTFSLFFLPVTPYPSFYPEHEMLLMIYDYDFSIFYFLLLIFYFFFNCCKYQTTEMPVERSGTISVIKLYVHRFLRIFPAVGFVMLVYYYVWRVASFFFVSLSSQSIVDFSNFFPYLSSTIRFKLMQLVGCRFVRLLLSLLLLYKDDPSFWRWTIFLPVSTTNFLSLWHKLVAHSSVL